MNENRNPPCKSHAFQCKKMSSLEDEGRITCPFSETDLNVDEGELEIDEEAPERVVSLESPFVSNSENRERERRKECVTRALEQLGGEFIVGMELVFDAYHKGK